MLRNKLARGLILGLLALFATIHGVMATPAAGVSATTISRGTLAAGVKINTENLKFFTRTDVDVVTQAITFAPGGHTGWHSHPGPAIVTILEGEMTLYNAADRACAPLVYGTGESFVDPGGGNVHIGRNLGVVDLVVYVTYLVPQEAGVRTDVAPEPAGCTG